MRNDLDVILILLANPPGQLIYHLVVSFGLVLTGSIALINKKSPAYRLITGCSLLLLFQVILFSFSIININALNGNLLAMRIIERMLGTLTVIWLVWTFLQEKQGFFQTHLNILLSSFLILLAAALIMAISTRLIEPVNNLHLVDAIWQSSTLILIIIGWITLLSRKPNQWVVASAMLLILASGAVIQMSTPADESLSSGAVRLAQTISLPWVIALTRRFSNKRDAAVINVPRPQENQDKAFPTKPDLINQLLSLNFQESQEERLNALVQALSLSIISDICYLGKFSPNRDTIQFLAGYDLIREAFLPAPVLNREQLPEIFNAWTKDQVLNLPQNHSGSKDRQTLSQLLNYHDIGSLLAFPLTKPGDSTIGGIIFLSPYTNKAWHEEAVSLLNKIKATLFKVCFTPDPIHKLKAALGQAHIETNNLIKENEQMLLNLTQKESDIKQFKAKYQIEKITTIKNIEALKSKIQELTLEKNLKEKYLTKIAHLETEINRLQDEREQLRSALSELKNQIIHHIPQKGQTGPIRLSMNHQIISLDSIIANARLEIASLLKEKLIELEIINPDGRQMLKTDPELVGSVLIELLHNATLASKPGGKVLLALKISLETGMLIIQVTDYGSGLTPEEQSAFFNAEQKTFQGIGSVMSIQNAIRAIRVLDGKIWLRSRKAAFTTFRVQLPVRIID